VFWSKIWFFLVAVVATAAIAVALVMPRPAERAALTGEMQRLARACSVANILLRDNARTRIQLAGEFARADAPPSSPGLRIDEVLYQASAASAISAEANASARKVLQALLDSVSGARPDFAMLLDRGGRVVARSGLDEKVYGDSVAGYFLVDDALAGYMRDDLWLMDSKLYRMAASPVVTRQGEWAGAVVLGQAIDKQFTDDLGGNLSVLISFYAAGQPVAASDTAQVHQEILEQHKAIAGASTDPGQDCSTRQPVQVSSGGHTYNALLARLPGEAGSRGAFYAVFAEQPAAVGFAGTLSAVRRDDLTWRNFPWLLLLLAFLAMAGGGVTFMVLETDRPLRRLTADAVRLAKGEQSRLEEERHAGRFGSIARSINIAIDKVNREARSARKEMDELLGPAPQAGAAPAFPAAPGAPLPPVAPSAPTFPGPAAPADLRPGADPRGAPLVPPVLDLGLPPPPALDLGAPLAPGLDLGAPPAAPTASPPARPPVPRGGRPPPPLPRAPAAQAPALPQADVIDTDILATTPAPASDPPRAEFDSPTVVANPSEDLLSAAAGEEAYFREVYEEFIALKKKCGERIDNIHYDKFIGKLRDNRDTLIAKHGCKEVRFQVYVKDGKAALKASPVKP
jgi:hypothetical protein